MLTLPSTSTSSNREVSNCQICSQPSHGNHFGAISCRACSAFFRRSIIGSFMEFRCRIGDGNCQAKNCGRFICKKCRLDRCFQVGMTTEKVQLDRDLISSTHSFGMSRKRKLLSAIVPQTVQGFVGRPVFILSCEPDSSNYERTFIDVKFLIDHASALFDNTTSKQTQFLNSMSLLQRLSYGLEETRLPIEDEIQLCTKIGKAEILMLWEHDFMTVAKWITYCDEFQQLPRSMKLQFLKSTWYMWSRLEIIATAVDFLDPFQSIFIPQIVEPLNQLEPTIQEMTYMLCLISFRHGGKQLGGDYQKLTDGLIENLANDLHNYYLNNLKLANYAGRIAKMMQIVKLVEKDMYERIELMQLGKVFDIFILDFSHPEMFYSYER